MLKVEDIHVYYGNIHAVKGISFHVDEGEIVSLIGANGAGKSTVLKTISGVLRAKSGSISFLGHDITKVEAHKIVRQGIAHVPEGRRIFLKMTVMENLEMGAFTRKEVSKEDVEKVFERFPRLKERQSQIAGTLSGGEQQMLAMGRALMSSPKLLMLDERRHHHFAGGAKCGHGSGNRRPGLCAGDRPYQPERYRRRARG